MINVLALGHNAVRSVGLDPAAPRSVALLSHGLGLHNFYKRFHSGLIIILLVSNI